ncbi:hypothetical protein BYT27DRAFT_7260521 [Phlegmacium glaucopus]|nr:hypothetical protein BYT27DRAFT_7260521 [Phlegmacium glaucopus]
MLENSGSTARDFCMLERNILSHFKLALLLSLLSSSLLLHARLVPPSNPKDQIREANNIPLASLQFVAAIASIAAGLWEYYQGFQDMRMARAFLAAPRLHFIIMSTVAGAVFGTCVVLLVQQS